jgi:hypothetical protein
MFRAVIAVVVSVLVLGAAGDLRLAALGEVDPAVVDRACDYYKRRSGPRPERAPVTFAAFLSETCAAARQSLGAVSPAEQATAALLLSRIVLLRGTIGEMNAARDLAVAGKTGVERMRALSRVTPSGEFLIAHRMGLMRALDAWLDTGADFSLASYR